MPPPLLPPMTGGRRWLIVTAAPKEAAAAQMALGGDRAAAPWETIEAGDRFDVVLSGVGKANAAGATARALHPERHGGVLSVGVCGALPDANASVLDVILASSSVYADEGLVTAGGFQDAAHMGFPPGMDAQDGVHCPASPDLVAALREAADLTGAIATVSTCSGTDEAARTVRDRTGAVAEAMEGAAVGFCAQRIAALSGAPILFGEIRVASNRTGERARQGWDLDGALARLSDLCARL